MDEHNNNALSELPFNKLSDFQIQMEFEMCRQKVDNILNGNGLKYYLDNLNTGKSEADNVKIMKYLDVDEYNHEASYMGNRISLFHVNIRMLSKHHTELSAYLDSFCKEFDIVVLSEIGQEGYRYISCVFNDYDYFYAVPDHNRYGGVAIMIKKVLVL